jgi:hypothetical protein
MSASGVGAEPPSKIGRQHFLCFLPLSQGQGSFGARFKAVYLPQVALEQGVTDIPLKIVGKAGKMYDSSLF